MTVKTAKDLKIPYSWEDRQPVLLEKFFYIPPEYSYSKKNFPLFSDDKPIIVEYCSGNGEWVGDRAKQNPQFNWLAVEKRFARARTIWLKVQRESIQNLTVVCGDAQVFTRYYAPAQICEAYINFPDPWPKRRHAKHRLVQAEFLSEVWGILQSKGHIVCATDHAMYATEMRQEFEACPGWNFRFHVNEWPDYGRSFFNDLWVQRGRVIHYLSFEKNQ